MNRKHTANIMRDLPDLVYAMISDVVAGWLSQECRYEGYQETSLNQSKTDEIMGAALRNKSIPASKHDQVLKEWNEPKHEEFEPRNAWSMFNAFTEVMKTAPRQLPKRTITLHRVFDEFCEDAITSRMESRGVARQSDFNIDDVEDAEIVGGLGLTYQLG
jgi:hypothetical protein